MLPIETKQAMLVGLDNETIITGAYTHDGGICPMLAAHRRGGRTSRESFAHAWDNYTGATKGRVASERELRTLRTMLEASLVEPFDLAAEAAAIRERKPEPLGPDRSVELARLERSLWSRLFRRRDIHAAALAGIEDGVAADSGGEQAPVLVPDLTR